MTALVVRGDALHLPLRDNTVDLIVTSPPYFALRDYATGHEMEVGSEATPQAYLEALWTATREMKRVLKPTGSIWINLGDKYSGNPGGPAGATSPVFDGRARAANWTERAAKASTTVREKSLIGLPWRYAIGCIDQLGLILRRDLIWSKPNCLSGGAFVYARVKGRPLAIRVHDLCRAYQPEDVQLWNGQRWTQAVYWEPTARDESAPALEIELRSGERIGCTREHRWPTTSLRGVVRADELQVGDVLETARLPEGETQPAALDDEMVGWFVGLYIAEGSRSERTIQIAGHINETERYKRLRELAEAFHARCSVYVTKGNAATINLAGRFLDAILETYVGGRTAKDKHLAPKCWQRSNRFLRAVLDGYLSGDGHYETETNRWIVRFTSNDALAADLRTLGARLHLSVRLRRVTHTGFDRQWPGWSGSIVEPERRQRPNAEVVAIRPSRARQFWDIGVEDDPHLFALASGVLTHNSLPESVTDRPRSSHEYWFGFVKQPRYFAALDELREPYEIGNGGRQRAALRGTFDYADSVTKTDHTPGQAPQAGWKTSGYNPLGKLPGSVWSIPSEPLRLPDWLNVNHYACVDAETEILTRRGWLRHDQLQAGDYVAGYDQSGWARWTMCHAVHRYEHDGPMVAVEKRDLSMRLTPNHRALAQRFETRERILAPLTFVRADRLGPQHYIPRSAPWLETIESQGPGETIAALCGWIAAEGWYTSTGQVRLSQSRSANPEKVAAIDKLLNDLTLLPAPDRSERRKYRHTLDAVQRVERVRAWKDRQVTDVSWALPLGLSQAIRAIMPDKLLTETMLQWSPAERQALLDAFIDGDGHRRPTERISIFQKHRHNLDLLQAIAVMLGYKTTLRRSPDKWVLYLTAGGRPITLRGTNGTHAPIPQEHYRGVVWCPQTDTGTFIARRNGSVFITGNSFPTEWPRRLILAFSPNGICTACGHGRFPVVERQVTGSRGGRQFNPSSGNIGYLGLEREARILGYACGCCPHTDHPGTGEPVVRTGHDGQRPPGHDLRQIAGSLGQALKVGPWREYHLDRWTPPPTRPAIVLDPFGGTGTTAGVARQLGRIGISLDLSEPYCRAARYRIFQSGDFGKAVARTWKDRQGVLL